MSGAENERAAPKVAVLPDALANQIAAGEVVERPASVVKELVENAIDAGASRILVDVEDAGRTLIRVVDDGEGMSPDDAALAVLRHATSKVRSADDLLAIGTLGFRGEALPSIASVSRFTLVTRREDDEVATEVRIIGGAAPEMRLAAAPVGTRIEVRDLFWNVPARLKFLKSDTTEQQQVVDLMKGFALGYPHVHFRLGTGQRTALDLPSVRKLHERVVQVLGREVGGRLFEVGLQTETLRVTGFVASAREAKAAASAMTCFVNGRRVKDRTIHHAIVSAFGSELAPGRFPQAVLWIHIDPSEVDVNVHPAKAEVRFRRPQVVHEGVVRAIQTMLLARPWVDASPLPLERHAAGLGPRGGAIQPLLTGHAGDRPTASRDLFAVQRPTLAPYAEPPRVGDDAREAPTDRDDAREVDQGPGTHGARDARPTEVRAPEPRPSHATELRFGERPTALLASEAPAWRVASPPVAAPASRRSTRLVGSARGLLVLELGEDLALVDPQAAVELMTLQGLEARPVAQPLLLPARLDLAPSEARAVLARCADFAAMGLEIEPFGGPTFQLLALPEAALGASPTTLLGELARLLGRRPDASELELRRAVAKVTAVGVRTPLDPRLIDRIVAWAESASVDARDHRGRRALLLLSAGEIARRLGDGG